MSKDGVPGRELNKTFKEGRRVKAQGFTLIFNPNQVGFSRLAVVAGRKLGLAVERNRVRRRLRELFRKSQSLLKDNFDIIVVVYPELKEQAFQETAGQWFGVLKKGGLIEKNSHWLD